MIPRLLNGHSRSTYTRLADVALTLGLLGGGTALAASLPDGSVESRHLKDGTVRSIDIANGTVTGKDVDETSLGIVPVAEGANTADEAIFAGQAETAERLLGHVRATVSATGKLRSTDFGAIKAEQTDTPGRYVVTFGGPVIGCFLLAGIAHNQATPVAGSASAWPTPFDLTTGLNRVTVETHSAGSSDTIPDPLPFNLMGFCAA